MCVGLEQGDGFFGQTSQDNAFDVAVSDALCSGRGNVFGEFFVIEVHERNTYAVSKGKRSLG